MSCYSAKIVLPEKLYHGTSLKINSDELKGFSQQMLNRNYWGYGKDFGLGFYTTHLFEQSKEWAERAPIKRARYEHISSDHYRACVLQIKFDLTKVRNPQILMFTDASRTWAQFILENRLQTKKSLPALDWDPDIVIGYMADNSTNKLVSQFKFDDSYTFDMFYDDIQRKESGVPLRMDQLGNQYNFCSEDMNAALELEGCYLLEKGEWMYHGIDDPYLSRFGLL
ncbi:DUF3990 domain-containing protein [Neobacillus pocheonensis]|uniref:DUF3990 domain-containing protein n=1 Tax=Neobacillus pocheonensis TaxID=363869 RepID=UPI003D26C6BA